jgi:hypothetical protein
LGLPDVPIELPSAEDMCTDFDLVFSDQVITGMRDYRDRGYREDPLPEPGDLTEHELLAAEEWARAAEGVLRRWARPGGIRRNFYYACRDLSIPEGILKYRMKAGTKLLCYRLVCRRLLQDCVRRGEPRAWLVDLQPSGESAATADGLAEGIWILLNTLIAKRRQRDPGWFERLRIFLKLSEGRTHLIERERIESLRVPQSTKEIVKLVAPPPETEPRAATVEWLCEHIEGSEERLQMAAISGILDQLADDDTLSRRIDNLTNWYRRELDPRFVEEVGEQWLLQSCRFLASMHVAEEFVITPGVQVLPRPDGMASRL